VILSGEEKGAGEDKEQPLNGLGGVTTCIIIINIEEKNIGGKYGGKMTLKANKTQGGGWLRNARGIIQIGKNRTNERRDYRKYPWEYCRKGE